MRLAQSTPVRRVRDDPPSWPSLFPGKNSSGPSAYPSRRSRHSIHQDPVLVAFILRMESRAVSAFPDEAPNLFFTNACSASYAPLTLSLSPSGGEGIDMAPSPSSIKRVGVRVAYVFTHDPG